MVVRVLAAFGWPSVRYASAFARRTSRSSALPNGDEPVAAGWPQGREGRWRRSISCTRVGSGSDGVGGTAPN